MASTQNRRTRLKQILSSTGLSLAFWASPTVLVVQLPSHAQATPAPGTETDPNAEPEPGAPAQPDPTGVLYNQHVSTCARASQAIYYEVDICNHTGLPVYFEDFVDKPSLVKTGPEITLNEPILPLLLEVDQCTTFRFSALSSELDFECVDAPILSTIYTLKESPSQLNISLTLDPTSYKEKAGGTATSTPPSIPPSQPPPEVAPPPSKPPPTTVPPDTATSTSRIWGGFRK